MKMEIPVVAEVDGVVVLIPVEEGGAVDEGKTVAVLEV
jgi:biotin carboxyl carrier protein